MSATYRAAFAAKAIHPVGVLLFAPELADGSPHFWRQPTARYAELPLALLDEFGAGVWFRDANGTVCRVRKLHPDRVWRDCDPSSSEVPVLSEDWSRLIEARASDGWTGKGRAYMFDWRADADHPIVKWRFAK